MIFEVPPVRPTPVAAAAREEAVHAAVIVGRLRDAAALVACRRVQARHPVVARGRVAGTESTVVIAVVQLSTKQLLIWGHTGRQFRFETAFC